MTHLIQGAGVGLRTPHLSQISNNTVDVPWLELLADNWLAQGGLDRQLLSAIANRYPLTLHGVNLSLGSLDPLNLEYLAHIKRLKTETDAVWYSEHCSFSSFNGTITPDLLPLPYTEEAIKHIAERILQAQEFMGERILIENVSCYVESNFNEMNEAEFLNQVVNMADCYLLLDINNVYVNSINHQFNARDYLNQMPISRVKQIHLAGHKNQGEFLLDTHDSQIPANVWSLYNEFIENHGSIPTLIEWDHSIPEWEQLLIEQQKAQTILDASKLVAA